ncbi:MAG: LysR family transcriptional regulator [Burkholderiaceae bacterium]|nr:LysR family transcriptional regulator [Burkholderiaceae bacterium]
MPQRLIDPLTLRHFVAICEEGTITRAAEREALVASALSKRLAALEADLGVSLLRRRRRGVELTAAGEALLARAREVLAAIDRARAEVGTFASGLQGSVRVLASPSVLAEKLPEDIVRFLRAHPGIAVSLDERISVEIVRSLREGAADVGVLWDIVDLTGVHVVPYRSDHLCVAVEPSHRLARRAKIAFAEALHELTIGVAPGGLMDQLLRRQAALLSRIYAPRVQVSSMEAAARLVAAGLGVAILPREAVLPHVGRGKLRAVHLAESWALRRFVVARRPQALQSAGARLLGDFLRAEAAGHQG